MIAMLRGTLEEKRPDQILLDVGGVGYRVFIALSTYETLPDLGKEVRIFTLTHVREDAFHLYGFATQEEKTLFVLLNNVNGVGTRLALAALSAMSPQALVSAIAAEEVGTLCQISGVGRKIAQRLVIELKDRLPAGFVATSGSVPVDSVEYSGEAMPDGGKRPARGTSSSVLREEIASALLNLGYKRHAVDRVLGQILADARLSGAHASERITTVGDGLRAALRILSRQVVS